MRLLLSVSFACSLMAADWVTIQPDASFKGWTRVPIKPTTDLVSPSQWQVGPDGSLICNGSRANGHVAVVHGLSKGDLVVTRGAVAIKAQMKKGATPMDM